MKRVLLSVAVALAGLILAGLILAWDNGPSWWASAYYPPSYYGRTPAPLPPPVTRARPSSLTGNPGNRHTYSTAYWPIFVWRGTPSAKVMDAPPGPAGGPVTPVTPGGPPAGPTNLAPVTPAAAAPAAPDKDR